MKNSFIKYLYLFPILLAISALSCNRIQPSDPDKSIAYNEAEPVVFSTSLADTLSQKAFDELNVGEVSGIKVKYLSGHENRYFEYVAEKQLVLRVISHLPFTKYSVFSDTNCRRISFNDLNTVREKISETEYENSLSFWNADPGSIEVYECIKSPLRHTLLFDSKSNHVTHRIEVLG